MRYALQVSATAYAEVARQKGGQDIYPYLDNLKEKMDEYGTVKPV